MTGPFVDTSCLFRSFKLGKVTLANRLVMAPMTRGYSPGGVPGPAVAAYYRRRALGGVGLIISEGTYPGTPSAEGYPDVPFFAGEGLSGWQQVIGAVHSAGAAMVPQLWHTGSFRRPGFDRGNKIQRLAPSAVAHPGYPDQLSQIVPKSMTLEEINNVIDAYAIAAGHAKDMGFDGVEVHGAHGYLIDQFLWSATNRRMDQYGGTRIRERARFAVEVVSAIRSRVGSNFPILFRFSNWKLGVYDERGKIFTTPSELAQLLEPLVTAGVDVFHASTRFFDNDEFDGSKLSLAGWTKKITGKSVITVGSVGLSADFISERQGTPVNPSSLERLIERMNAGEFDLVAIGRTLLSDPKWATKVRHHDYDTIIPYDRSCLSRLY